MIELFKDGDQMAIRTDCPTEIAFQMEFAELFSTVIEDGDHDGDWEFQLRYWLPQFVDICCKLRGYKADVETHTVLVAGARIFGDQKPEAASYPSRRSPGAVELHRPKADDSDHQLATESLETR